MGIRVRWPIDSCARFGSVGLRFLAFAWRHGDFYARVAIRRYVVGTIRLKKMPPTWAARLEEATMVDEAQLSKAVAALTAAARRFPNRYRIWDRHRRRSRVFSRGYFY